MRPVSWWMPWKPATTATSLRSLNRLIDFAAVDALDAGGAVGVGGQDRDLPALPGAGVDAHRLQRDRQQPGGDLLARGHDGVVFARIVQDRGFAAEVDQLVGRARHRRNDDGDLMAGVHLALDVARHVADAIDIGDRGTAEFHDQTGHCWTSRTARARNSAGMPQAAGAGSKRRVYIPARSTRRNRRDPRPQGRGVGMTEIKSWP